jgi:hypothetical protein
MTSQFFVLKTIAGVSLQGQGTALPIALIITDRNRQTSNTKSC